MQIIQAIILGVIQGLTEFIPVSSSGHLILFAEWLNFQGNLAFDLALHIGTLLALLVYFRRDVAGLIKGVFKPEGNKLSWLIILSTIPAILAGIALEDKAETAFRSPQLVAVNLVWIAVVMLLVDKWAKKRVELNKISVQHAVGMGLAQVLALVPGVSRSGSTITAGLAGGLTYEAATRFSFLMSAPVIFGAIMKVLLQDQGVAQVTSQPAISVVGITAAGVSGYLAIRFMLRFLTRFGLAPFAYYRIALGALVLLAL